MVHRPLTLQELPARFLQPELLAQTPVGLKTERRISGNGLQLFLLCGCVMVEVRIAAAGLLKFDSEVHRGMLVLRELREAGMPVVVPCSRWAWSGQAGGRVRRARF